MIIVKQSWWNIEDILSPADGKIYRKVIDLYTDEQFQYVYLPNFFLSLKIRDKLSGDFLPFVDVTDDVPIEFNPNKEVIMALNLGNLNKYSKVIERIDGTNFDLYHVRFEIEYIDPCPFFEKKWDLNFQTRFWKFWNINIKYIIITIKKFFKFPVKNKIDKISCKDYQISPIKLSGRPGYESGLISSGPTQPEFTIIVPRGMRLICDYKSTKLSILNSNANDEKLHIGKPHAVSIDGKESYNIAADRLDRDIVNKLKKEYSELKLHYKVINKHKFYLIPLFGLVLILIGCEGLNYISNNANVQQNSFVSFIFSYIIIQISFLTLYLTLRRDNYEIPFNSLIIPSIIISIILFVICLYSSFKLILTQ